jgi:hypothetical protein
MYALISSCCAFGGEEVFRRQTYTQDQTKLLAPEAGISRGAGPRLGPALHRIPQFTMIGLGQREECSYKGPRIPVPTVAKSVLLPALARSGPSPVEGEHLAEVPPVR